MATNNLIAFNDGSYKKVVAVDWKHSQWLHLTRKDGSIVRVNLANVNYIECTELAEKKSLQELMDDPAYKKAALCDAKPSPAPSSTTKAIVDR